MPKMFSTFLQTKSAQWSMLALGLIIGAIFPDIDRYLPFLQHRSLLTHGIFIPVLLFIWVRFRPLLHWVRTLCLGFCATLATHLSFDLFPLAWKGFALIHIPGYGRMSAGFSWGWIIVSIIGCTYLAASCILSGAEIFAALIGVGVVIVITGEPWLRPVVVLVVAILLTEGIEQGQDWLLDRIRQYRDAHEQAETNKDSEG